MVALHSTAHVHIDSSVPDICTLTCTFTWLEVRIIEVGLYYHRKTRYPGNITRSLPEVFLLRLRTSATGKAPYRTHRFQKYAPSEIPSPQRSWRTRDTRSPMGGYDRWCFQDGSSANSPDMHHCRRQPARINDGPQTIFLYIILYEAI